MPDTVAVIVLVTAVLADEVVGLVDVLVELAELPQAAARKVTAPSPIPTFTHRVDIGPHPFVLFAQSPDS
ncbi:MAG: hypothetical protein ACYCVN_02155 [Acidimicrobiales bacterium]